MRDTPHRRCGLQYMDLVQGLSHTHFGPSTEIQSNEPNRWGPLTGSVCPHSPLLPYSGYAVDPLNRECGHHLDITHHSAHD